jgi:peptidoglycan/LPS O-acetylase OafA/YrhL
LKNRFGLLLILSLIIFGVIKIINKVIPESNEWVYQNIAKWPMNIVSIGVILFVIALIIRCYFLITPAIIFVGVGAICIIQGLIGSDSNIWSYMWPLIIGFIGMGIVFTGLFTGKSRSAVIGSNFIAVSLCLFILFAAIYKQLSIFGKFGLPFLLLVVGLFLIIRTITKKRQNF